MGKIPASRREYKKVLNIFGRGCMEAFPDLKCFGISEKASRLVSDLVL